MAVCASKGLAMPKKRIGRPPAGRDSEGQPIPTRSFPQLTVRIRPQAKEELEALVRLPPNKTQGDVIERALAAYVRSLSPADKRTLEGLRAGTAGRDNR